MLELAESADGRNLPVPRIDAMDDVLGRMSAQRRFATELLAIFGVGGLLLAAVGLYGVVSCLVAERTREIGVRVAIGATNRDVLRLVLVRSLRPVALGLLAGMGGAVLVSRWLRSVLVEVGPADPLALAVAVTILLAVALMAAYVPARRATRVDPVEVLRSE
jgi:ABC-type antimicrobial peptide transport system permease subunit